MHDIESLAKFDFTVVWDLLYRGAKYQKNFNVIRESSVWYHSTRSGGIVTELDTCFNMCSISGTNLTVVRLILSDIRY